MQKLYSVLTKKGELAPLFTERQLPIAVLFAEQRDGKVIDYNTKKVVEDFCKMKHFIFIEKHDKKVHDLEKQFEKAIHAHDEKKSHEYFVRWMKENLRYDEVDFNTLGSE